jgi:folate-binding protein YgfZ
MVERSCVVLKDRAVVRVSGEDRRAFLQGLVSNDIDKVSRERSVYTALLTAQGRFLHDFFISEISDALCLDAEGARRADLLQRLTGFKLRARVTVEPDNKSLVAVAFGDDALASLSLQPQPGYTKSFEGAVAYVDPRLSDLGARLILEGGATKLSFLERAGFQLATDADYDLWRLSLGIPDGSRDMTVGKATLLESGFDDLNGIDWQKGCYIGQELTARMKYRGLVKRRLIPVKVEGGLPQPGTPVMCGDKEVGEMRSGRDGIGIALLYLEVLQAPSEGEPVNLTAGVARLKPARPAWASF